MSQLISIDSKLMDRSLKKKHDISEFSSIIAQCKYIFAHVYRNSNVEFVRGQVNEVAHTLANAAILTTSFHILVNISNCIEHILSNKMV